VRIFKVLEEEEHAKAEPAEPIAVFDGLSPEEFADQFFGGGSVREPQEGLASPEWLKGRFKTKSAAIRYLHSDLGGAHVPKDDLMSVIVTHAFPTKTVALILTTTSRQIPTG
jgi:hypothetical protein